jgi:hypothetical protein
LRVLFAYIARWIINGDTQNFKFWWSNWIWAALFFMLFKSQEVIEDGAE